MWKRIRSPRSPKAEENKVEDEAKDEVKESTSPSLQQQQQQQEQQQQQQRREQGGSDHSDEDPCHTPGNALSDALGTVNHAEANNKDRESERDSPKNEQAIGASSFQQTKDLPHKKQAATDHGKNFTQVESPSTLASTGNSTTFDSASDPVASTQLNRGPSLLSRVTGSQASMATNDQKMVHIKHTRTEPEVVGVPAASVGEVEPSGKEQVIFDEVAASSSRRKPADDPREMDSAHITPENLLSKEEQAECDALEHRQHVAPRPEKLRRPKQRVVSDEKYESPNKRAETVHEDLDPWSLEQFSPLQRAARPSKTETLAQVRLGDVQRRCEETVSQFSADVQNLSIELAKCKQELVRERERKRGLERVRSQYEKDINALSRELRTMTVDMREDAQRRQQMEEREGVLRSLLSELGLKQVAGIRMLFRSQRDRIAELEASMHALVQDLEWSKQSHRHVQEQCHAMEKELQEARKARWEADSKRMKVDEEREKEALAHRRSKLLCSHLRAQVAHLGAQLQVGAVSPRTAGPSGLVSPTSPQSKFAGGPQLTRGGSGSPGGSLPGAVPRVPQLQHVIGAKNPASAHRPPYGGARKTTFRFS